MRRSIDPTPMSEVLHDAEWTDDYWQTPDGKRIPYQSTQIDDLDRIACAVANYHGDTVEVKITRWPRNTAVAVEYSAGVYEEYDTAHPDVVVFIARILKIPHAEFNQMPYCDLVSIIVGAIGKDTPEDGEMPNGITW